MTKSNRKTCDKWSKHAIHLQAGLCEECNSPLFLLRDNLYMCKTCGLEQHLNRGEQSE